MFLKRKRLRKIPNMAPWPLHAHEHARMLYTCIHIPALMHTCKYTGKLKWAGTIYYSFRMWPTTILQGSSLFGPQSWLRKPHLHTSTCLGQWSLPLSVSHECCNDVMSVQGCHHASEVSHLSFVFLAGEFSNLLVNIYCPRHRFLSPGTFQATRRVKHMQELHQTQKRVLEERDKVGE